MKIFYSILFILFSFICYGQDEREQLSILIREATELMSDKDYETAIIKSNEAYTIARKKDWEDEAIQCLSVLSRISELQDKPEAVLKYKLEKLDYNIKINDPYDIYENYEEIAILYRKQEIYNKSISNFHAALSYIPKENEYSTKEHIWEELAITHSLDLNYDSTRYYHTLLLEKSKEKNDINNQLFHFQKIADAWSNEGNFPKCISVYNDILKIAEKNNDNKNIATAHNNIGIAYTKYADYETALSSLKKAEEICNEKPLVDLSILYSNIGIAYHNLDNKKESISYLLKAIKFSENGESKYLLNHKLAKIYFEHDDLYNAATQNDLVYQNTNNKKLKSQSLKTAADIKQGLYEFENAFEFYQQHLEIEQEFRIIDNLEKQKLLELKTKLERSEKEIRLEMAAKEIEENRIKSENDRLAFEKRELILEKERIKLEQEKNANQLALLEEEQKVKQAEILAQQAALKTKELESETQQQQLALAQQKLESERNERELEEVQRQQELQQMELNASKDRELLKQKELETSRMEQEAQSQLLDQEKKLSTVIRTGALIGGIVAALIIGLVLWFLRISNRNNKKLAQQNDEIEQQRAELEKNRDLIAQEQEKSEALLLNILPGAIANELKEKGFATPKEYEQVTVLFTDFGGFTRVSAMMDADDLIEELNTCFMAFDDIISKYDIQPIKTIGDSYMCAGGVPIEGSVSPSKMVNAALEINTYMNQRLAEKEAAGIPYWSTRIGLHSGPVIAGVVGKKKFAYDIWGDAVNTASRMESGAEPNTINISEATYELVKNDFECSYRGEFKVKNKGVMKMYKVNSRKLL